MDCGNCKSQSILIKTIIKYTNQRSEKLNRNWDGAFLRPKGIDNGDQGCKMPYMAEFTLLEVSTWIKKLSPNFKDASWSLWHSFLSSN